MTLYIWNPPRSCPCPNDYIDHKLSCNKNEDKKKEAKHANPDNESQMSVHYESGIPLGHMDKSRQNLA